MPEAFPDPRAGSVYEHDGHNVVLERPHSAEPNVWIAHPVDNPERREFVARAYLIGRAPISVGTGEIPASVPVSTPAPIPTVAPSTRRRRQAAEGASEAQAPAPAQPTCPACHVVYTGALGVAHRCARVLESQCMACNMINTTALTAAVAPAYPYLCTQCIQQNTRVCKTCSRVITGTTRSGSVCNQCTTLMDINIWTRLHGQARGNSVIVEVGSHRPFAVEIECYVLPAESTIDASQTPGTHWDRAQDGSIRPEEGGVRPTEFRSPPFRGDEGLAMLSTDVKKIRAMGYRANKSCGLHVHVDAIDLKTGDLAALNKFGNWIQNDLYKFVAPSRTGNQYCRKLNGTLSNERYHWLNLKPSWDRHRTVEFRLHHGITIPERTTEWVKVCLAIVEKGLRIGYQSRCPSMSLMEMLGFTEFQKKYWTSISKALHGERAVLNGASLDQ